MPLNEEDDSHRLYKILSEGKELRKDDFALLTSQFIPLHQDGGSSGRSQSYLVLSMICERVRDQLKAEGSSASIDDTCTSTIVGFFQSVIEEKLADVHEPPLIEAISFITALFTVDWKAAAAFFTRDGFQDSLLDALELFPSSKDLSFVVASLMACSCGYVICRSCFDARLVAWLKTCAGHQSDNRLAAISSLALLKYSQGSNQSDTITSPAIGPDELTELATEENRLFQVFRDIAVQSTKPVPETIEGLAYLSTKATYKNNIIEDDALLKRIVSFQPFLTKKPQSQAELGSIPFGLAAVIANLCTYRPQLSEEQTQIEKLRKFASARNKTTHSIGDIDYDNDEHVKLRGKRLLSNGVVNLLLTLSQTTQSSSTKILIGKALLGLVEDKDNRGKLLQLGVSKTLLGLINSSRRTTLPDGVSESNGLEGDYEDMTPIQALAKLTITSSPLQVYGPNDNMALDAIRPLTFMLLSSRSTLLQKFESMMALTNLSTSMILAARIAESTGFLEKVELHLLEEHQLIRRAACELVCNLVSNSDKGFEFFSGELRASSVTRDAKRAKSRLQILIALTDVDDVPTRSAASGALAILTTSSEACKHILSLESEHHRAFALLKRLIELTDENGVANEPGLIHRGVVCLHNILLNSPEGSRKNVVAEAANRGFVQAFVTIIRNAGQPSVPDAALRPAAEVLKLLSESGINLGV